MEGRGGLDAAARHGHGTERMKSRVIERWVEAHLAGRRISANSLIISVYGDLIAVHGGVVSLAGGQADWERRGSGAAPEDVRLAEVLAQVWLEQLDLQAAHPNDHVPAGPE